MATVQQYKPKTRKVTIGYTNTALYGWQRQNQSALDLINQYNTRVNNGEWLSVEDRAKYKSAVDTYTSSGTALRNASKHYGTTYTDEEEKSWLDSLSSLNTGYTGINDFYNQFESDKVYGDWLESKNRDEAYNSNFTNIDTNKATQGWEKYNADYKPKGMTKEEMVQMGFETMNDNPLVSAFNHAVYTYKNDDSYMRPNDNWSQEQKNVFGQLYLENPAKAYEFAEETNNRNNKAKEEATIKSIQDMAVNNPILNTLGSIAAAPYAWADYFNNMAKIAAGRDVNKYNTSDGIVTPGEYSQAVQSGITTHLNDTYGTIKVDIPFLKGFVDEVGLGTVYGLGTSIAQSLIYGKLGKLAGLNGLSSSAIGYFGSAATNGMNDAIQRGATDEVGLLYGTILGVLEVGMESIGLDNLIKMDASKTMSGLVKNIFAQSLSEGGEELGTSIGTSVADILLLGDKSAFAYDVSFYKNKGYNDKDAKWAAFGDMLGGWMQDATTGAISGGVSGAAMAVPSTIYSNTMANRYHSDKAPSMVNELITNEGTKAIGEKYQNKINSGKKLSGFDVSHMLDLTDRAKVKDAITNQLTEYGETSDISTLAEALTKQTMGEELSNKESKLIEASKYGNRIANELNPENIKSGQYTSKWAESIGTRRLNADVYSRRPSTKVKTKDGTNNTITNVRNVADGIATVELADGKVAKVGLDKGITSDVVFNDPKAENLFRIATDRVGKVDGWTTETANAMIKGYDGTTSDVDYRKAYTMAFDMGKEGVETSQVVSLANKSGVKGATLLGAYDMGRQATEKTLTNTAQSGKIESEVKTDESTGIYLRNGGEWNGSANPEGQVFGLEESTGRDTSREDAGRKVADSEAVKLVNEGRKVRVADLGILNGSKTQTVTIVDKSQETAEMTKAREKAEARGVKARFFLGDNLVIEENGELISARAYIKGDYVFVRADHPLYTADQLMSHEMGHDMVAKGEIDINKVRTKLAETVGKENIDLVADMYELAYRGSNLSADEIWEECICDSLGNMNVFSGKAEIDQGIMTMVLADIKKATEDTKTAPNKTRGAPDGKASREAVRKKKKNKVTIYLSTKDVGTSNMQYINKQLLKLYRGLDSGIADGIAIENEGIIFIVDSGKENGVLNFAVRKRIKVSNEDLRLEYIRRTNNESISNGYISDELSPRVRNGYDNDWGRNLRREFGEELQVDTGKSSNNQSGISQKNGDNRGLGKTSRELDSLGNELTKEQAEFFKDSKVTQGIR